MPASSSRLLTILLSVVVLLAWEAIIRQYFAVVLPSDVEGAARAHTYSRVTQRLPSVSNIATQKITNLSVVNTAVIYHIDSIQWRCTFDSLVAILKSRPFVENRMHMYIVRTSNIRDRDWTWMDSALEDRVHHTNWQRLEEHDIGKTIGDVYKLHPTRHYDVRTGGLVSAHALGQLLRTRREYEFYWLISEDTWFTGDWSVLFNHYEGNRVSYEAARGQVSDADVWLARAEWWHKGARPNNVNERITTTYRMYALSRWTRRAAEGIYEMLHDNCTSCVHMDPAARMRLLDHRDEFKVKLFVDWALMSFDDDHRRLLFPSDNARFYYSSYEYAARLVLSPLRLMGPVRCYFDIKSENMVDDADYSGVPVRAHADNSRVGVVYITMHPEQCVMDYMQRLYDELAPRGDIDVLLAFDTTHFKVNASSVPKGVRLVEYNLELVQKTYPTLGDSFGLGHSIESVRFILGAQMTRDGQPYKHVWFVEDDVHFTGSWRVLFDAIERDDDLRDADVMVRYHGPVDDKGWWDYKQKSLEPQFADYQGNVTLLQLTRFSARYLQHAHHELSSGRYGHEEILVRLMCASLAQCKVREFPTRFIRDSLGQRFLRWRPVYTELEVFLVTFKYPLTLMHPVKCYLRNSQKGYASQWLKNIDGTDN